MGTAVDEPIPPICRLLTLASQNKELHNFYLRNPKGSACDETPARLDRLLVSECDGVSGLESQLEGLTSEQLEFLKFGLAYHISRQEDSVRLSTKIHVKEVDPAAEEEG